MSTSLKDEIKKTKPADYAKRMAEGAKGLDPKRVHAMGVLLAMLVAGGSSLDLDGAIAKAREIAEGASDADLADLTSEESE